MTPGYGQCGCERPDRHERGCLWRLDGRKAKVTVLAARLAHVEAQLAAVIAITAPRPGCCLICGSDLDRAAREANDLRCTPCYRTIFARRSGGRS